MSILNSNIIGSGKPFIILHGFLGMGDNWKTLAKQFAAQGFEIHLVDQRNHGRSFHHPDFNYQLMAEDVLNYFQHHQIESATVLGHSMGGKTAMRFACLYPELVNHLIVADISPRYYPIHHQTILNGLSSLNLEVIKSRREADKALSNYIFQKSTRQFLLKNLYWVEKGKLGLRINLEVLKAQVSEVGEALPKHLTFNGKTLFLRGDRSEYIGINDFDLIKKHFPLLYMETISNAGHWLHAENPKDFYGEVMSFLEH